MHISIVTKSTYYHSIIGGSGTFTTTFVCGHYSALFLEYNDITQVSGCGWDVYNKSPQVSSQLKVALFLPSKFVYT